MIKNGPEREDASAARFYDWALGESAAEIFASYFVVPFMDIPHQAGAFSIRDVEIIHQDDQWSAANKQRLVERWNQLIGSAHE